MKVWTKSHRSLLAALRAERLVPQLIRRLSLERCPPRDDDARLLRDWIAELRASPGWRHLEPTLAQPRAWPDVWHDAVDAGFSPRADHHHALLFERFCDELVDAYDFEVARFAWQQCVGAWMRVFDTDYPDVLFDQLADSVSEQTRRGLLLRLVEARDAELRDGLRIDEADPLEHLDRRKVRFAWSALDYLDEALEPADELHETLAGLQSALSQTRERTISKVLARFSKMVDALDLSEAPADTIARPFEWMAEVFTILPITTTVAAKVVDALVDTAWKLRKLERDGGDRLLRQLLDLGMPFNAKLAGYIESGEAFGHNSLCADFMVFRGEQRDRTQARRPLFERALQICPGHRNAAMMLSYEKLRQASDLLLRMRLMPSAVRVLPGAAERVETAVREAAELVDAAEELYPSNEEIAEYRDQVHSAAARLGATIDE